jgi:2-polyprenyl-3-methyl-5-hydroxy-6-metoxy-1,4-benzoquinol methylase
MQIKKYKCHVCTADNIHLLSGFQNLKQVTSDAKPFAGSGILAICNSCHVVQKIIDDRWHQEAIAIYKNYSLYYQSNTRDQIIIDPDSNLSNNRSEKIAHNLREFVNQGSGGKILDYGCGKGAFLTAFSSCYPRWDIFGADNGLIQEEKIREIPRFKKYYSCEPEAINELFDVVSLIHVLEHVSGPIEFLKKIAGLINDDGIILVQVPNFSINQIDMVVADHCSHFNLSNLRYLMFESNLKILTLSEDWITKEITCIVQKKLSFTIDQTNFSTDDGNKSQQKAELALKTLLDTALRCKEIADKKVEFGIFGTSIAGVWLDSELNSSTTFFCDEDPGRVDKNFMGRPVYHPKDVGDGKLVMMPFIDTVARRIAERYPNIEPIYLF